MLVTLAVLCVVAVYFWLPSLPPSLFAGWTPVAQGKLWTVTGIPNSPREVFVDLDGSFQTGVGCYSTRFYLYDNTTGKLIPPPGMRGAVRHSLLSGWMPAPVVEWARGGIKARTMVFAQEFQGTETCFCEVTVTNIGRARRSLSLFTAVLPYEITGALQGNPSISYDHRRHAVLSNGRVFLACKEPDAFGAVWSDPRRHGTLDATCYIRDGLVPPEASVGSPVRGLTSAALKYVLELGPGESRTFRFTAPIGSDRKLIATDALPAALKEFRKHWSNELGRAGSDIPEARMRDCYRACLAYLMILSDERLPRPGAYKYQAFWVRDFAYIADALHEAGRSDLVRPGLEQLRRMQLPNGGFRPTTASSLDDELDAPGEAIYAIVQYYRRTGDRELLGRYWPVIASASRYIRLKRIESKHADPCRRGILPASRSAEDIGSPRIQHYWDDFWCIRGLRDASFAADALGHHEDAVWMRGEADSLYRATWNSIRAVARKHNISYIPNGPEDVTSSSMARGTSCGVWPCAVLDPNDPFVKKSFDVYWEKWIEPSGGGFKHNRRFWPYAGLDLAHCYIALGQPDRARRIVRWTLDHDPTSGFYAWPEGANARNLTLEVGDIPHGWFCASYALIAKKITDGRGGPPLR